MPPSGENIYTGSDAIYIYVVNRVVYSKYVVDLFVYHMHDWHIGVHITSILDVLYVSHSHRAAVPMHHCTVFSEAMDVACMMHLLCAVSL